jgi:hypothetical protein
MTESTDWSVEAIALWQRLSAHSLENPEDGIDLTRRRPLDAEPGGRRSLAPAPHPYARLLAAVLPTSARHRPASWADPRRAGREAALPRAVRAHPGRLRTLVRSAAARLLACESRALREPGANSASRSAPASGAATSASARSTWVAAGKWPARRRLGHRNSRRAPVHRPDRDYPGARRRHVPLHRQRCHQLHRHRYYRHHRHRRYGLAHFLLGRRLRR